MESDELAEDVGLQTPAIGVSTELAPSAALAGADFPSESVLVAVPTIHYGDTRIYQELLDGQQIELSRPFDGSVRPVSLTLNFNTFTEFFQALNEWRNELDQESIRAYCDHHSIPLTPDSFATLHSCTTGLSELLQRIPQPDLLTATRAALLAERGEELCLSDLFQAGCQEAREVALLAQRYLQINGIASSCVFGWTLADSSNRQAAEHAFNLIQENGRTLVFDPAHSILTHARDEGLPIYIPLADINQALLSGEKALVASRQPESGDISFFGAADRASINRTELIGIFR